MTMADTTQPNGSTALAQSGGDQVSPFSDEGGFTAAQRMAKALASSSLMPAAFQNNIPNCLIAMELAHRVRASVMMVAQNLDIIHGNPSWRSKFLIACVNSSGRFTPLRFRFQGEEGKPSWGCRAVAKDIDTGEECVGPLVTIKMANDEGWSKKNGSKWITMPELMLTYRSAAFWSRIFAPELSLGMRTSDEAEDMISAYSGAGAPLPQQLTPGAPAALENAIGLPKAAPVDAPVDAVIVDEDGVVVGAKDGKREPEQQELGK